MLCLLGRYRCMDWSGRFVVALFGAFGTFQARLQSRRNGQFPAAPPQVENNFGLATIGEARGSYFASRTLDDVYGPPLPWLPCRLPLEPRELRVGCHPCPLVSCMDCVDQPLGRSMRNRFIPKTASSRRIHTTSCFPKQGSLLTEGYHIYIYSEYVFCKSGGIPFFGSRHVVRSFDGV